jgi:hypothetical protein
MTTITQRKKLSKGTWALIIIAFVALIAVVVTAFLGYISLQFLADWATGTMMFGATGWVNAIIVLVTPFVGGILVCYVAYRYFIGQKVTAPLGNNYVPQGQSVSPAGQSGSETVIS